MRTLQFESAFIRKLGLHNSTIKKGIIVAAGVAGIVCWLLTFGVGVLVSSQAYRDQLAKAFDWGSLIKAIITYTPTNVAILSVLAGFLGGCASWLLYYDGAELMSEAESGKPGIDPERLTFLTENPVNSALRGFAIYLTFLAGTVLGANQPFSSTTQDQYCRMAGAVGILAFAVGYDPTFFRQFISALPRKK
jgi:hypothetical protein